MKRFSFAVLSVLLLAAQALAAPPDYLRDIRPILAANCFSCHGQDEKKRSANLRLDAPNRAVVGGDLLASALYQRIQTTGARRMPPPETGHTLTTAQKATLGRWIVAGAPYAAHWAFVPIPAARPGSSIDGFVRTTLREKGLAPAPEADRYTLIRRLSLDLIGLPPTPGEVAAFVADTRPDAYERVVDRLLASPHFGERWARPWLDLARYADSAGYGSDPLRPNIWPYRDWVIAAFNANMPFDQFTREQIAGDLLPGATDSQRIATAFHRNTMTNTEGGTDDEEFRTAAVKDRTIVTMQVWMGLTFGCAQCHSHKYDPIRQSEFYSLMAFFNQTEDNDQPDERPTLAVLSAADRAKKRELEAQLAVLEKKIVAEEAAAASAPLPRARFVRITQPGENRFLMLAEVEVRSGGQNLARSGKASQSSTDYGGTAGRAIDGNTSGNFNDNSVTHTAAQTDPWWEVDLGSEQPIRELTVWARTDAHVGTFKNFRVTLLDANRKPVGERLVAEAPAPSLLLALRETPSGREAAAIRAALAALKPVSLPVLRELPAEKQRTTHILTLANFLQPEAVVTAATPAAFPAFPPSLPKNRLGLAQWLLRRENPLTARVMVNRFWAQLFGTGLVETEEDFGTQGTLPSHPALLDFLADRFRSDWDVKRLLKSIVLSQTYRQSSLASPTALARDPRNRWLSHYPRRRLDAEGVRDQALALSGLLSPKLGGPSVYPPQPDGLWRAAFNGERTWPTSTGEDRYRRGIYTFWRRTVPYPSMQTFDAPSREFCTIRRQPTNTPLQALVTLNDPAYLEMAQALGRRVLAEGGTTDESRARYALQLVLGRPARPEQVAPLVALVTSETAHYATRPDAAKTLAGTPPTGAEPAVAAAWTVVGNVLLNLDGVLTKG